MATAAAHHAPTYEVSAEQIETFERDGAVLLPGLFRDWVEVIAAGIERNMAEPGPYATENVAKGDGGRFFDDYCNWERIPEIGRMVRESPAARAVAALMRSRKAQIFHDHVLVKEPGTAMATPWHQDGPYYFVEGRQTASLWIPIDPVKEATLRLIPGSHLWPKPVRPARWSDDSDYFPTVTDYLPIPDPDSDPALDVVEWQMQPGDAVVFNFMTVHGSRGNHAQTRRRALSLRWVGDDARYVERPGRTSPPYPGHGMSAGQTLREDWFPVIWRDDADAG